MAKKTKIWFIVASSLILVGVILFLGVMSMNNWNFKTNYETNNYELGENFTNISISISTADITFLPSQTAKVVCYENANEKHSVKVTDNTLTIGKDQSKKWYQYIGIGWGTPKITIYLPTAQYENLFIKTSTGSIDIPQDFSFSDIDISVSTGHVNLQADASQNVKLKASTGDITVQNVSAKSLDVTVSTGTITATNVNCSSDTTLEVSTGKTYLTDVSCNNLTSRGSTGDIKLKNVVASGKMDIKRSTGDVNFESLDAAELLIITDTGDVKGALRSDKVFIVKSDTGSINVPESINGGKCKITTDTGDVKITIE